MTDSYYNLKASSKNLLTYLIVFADDDGFCDTVSTAIRQSKSRRDTLQALSEAGFIICFTKNLVVISNWKQMNQMPPSKYTETRYKAEKAELTVDENGIYHRKDERA